MTRGNTGITTTVPLVETSFCNYYYSSREALFLTTWKPSPQLTEAGFKAECVIQSDIIKRYKPRFILLDNTHFGYQVPPDLQEWFADTLGKIWTAPPLQRIAQVYNHHLLVQVSLEMIGVYINQLGLRQIEHRTFNDRDEAYKWLVN